MTSVGRLNLGLGTALVALAPGAWYLVVVQSAGMSMAMEISIPVYLATWVTMLAAMMLPATAPLALAYGRVTQARGGGRLTALPFTAGYILLWTSAGLIPLAVFIWSRGLVAGMTASPLGPLALSAVLVGAGLYQLSPWKAACLGACRSPIGFVVGHDFDSGARGGLLAGARPRRVLPRVLLGADGRTDRRGADEPSLDGRPFAAHPGRKELEPGAGPGSNCWCGHDRGRNPGGAVIDWRLSGHYAEACNGEAISPLPRMLTLGAVMVAEKTLPGGGRLVAPIAVVLILGGALLAFGWRMW
ncbi:MAG: DUF2182 domain-containing protein [Candidatus Dormibacteraeota bacterium]|nr:DUF2182 domain-containing protein [Candidatus Dormibacteraeota bacterium]